MSAPSPSPTSSSAPRGDPPTPYMLMGDLIDKLKLLHYESEVLKKKSEFRPLSPIYFINSTKPNEQFSYFLSLASFLLKLSSPSSSDSFDFNEFDDPIAISTTLCDAVKKLGMAVDFPPSKLRLGSGDQILSVLDFLCDKAIAKGKIVMNNPIYREQEIDNRGMERKGGNSLDDDDDEDNDNGKRKSKGKVDDDGIREDDDIADEVDDDMDSTMDDIKSDAKSDGLHVKDNKESKDSDTPSPFSSLPTTNPEEWKLELERVGPKLKTKGNNVLQSKEWRSRIELASKHYGELTEVIPNTKTGLEKLHANLSKIVEKISSAEKKINKDFDSLGADYHAQQKEYEEIQSIYNNLQKDIGNMTGEYQRYSDEVDELKSKMSEKNNSMNDTQPLRKITTALSEIKKEIGLMELRIGIVGQTVQMMKLKVYNEEFKKQSAQIQMMKKGGGGAKGGKEEGRRGGREGGEGGRIHIEGGGGRLEKQSYCYPILSCPYFTTVLYCK